MRRELLPQSVAGRFFRSFSHRSYRLLWFSDGGSSSAEQIEFVALAWFVLVETDSALWLGVYTALRFTGTLFSPFYGILVDRYDRRNLLLAARGLMLAVAAIIAALAFSGQIQVWHIFALTGVAGMVRAFDNVTRQTLIADLVARRDLSNAIAMTRMGRDATQIAGPVFGGALLEWQGLGWTYAAVVALHLSGALLALPLRAPARAIAARGSSAASRLLEGMRYARGNQAILALLLLAFLVNLTGFPLNQGLVPVFARDTLGTDASGLGWLLGAYSAGAFAGSALIAGMAQMRRAGRTMVLGAVGWHAAVAALSQMGWFGASMGVLAIAGITQSFTMVTMSILLLGSTPPEIRGRVMGLRSLAVYGLPLGLLASGWIADTFGIAAALAANGAVGIAATAAIVAALRGIWGE